MTNSTIPVDVLGIPSGAIAVASGEDGACALTMSGGIKCWGEGRQGQLGNGVSASSASPVDVTGLSSGEVSVIAGGAHNCALSSAGGLKCWGYNIVGELGDGTTGGKNTPVPVTGLAAGVTVAAAGTAHTCARVAGRLRCWGDNSSGQLGTGDTTDSSTPVEVVGF